VRVADIVVWDKELEEIRLAPLSPKLVGADLNTIAIPLAEITRELFLLRIPQITLDMLKGAYVGVKQGPGSLALLMPVCSTFIMQTLADVGLAEDKEVVAGFAASLTHQWMLLHLKVQEAVN